MMSLPETPLYFDYQATTPCDPRVVQAMAPLWTEMSANPHSTAHESGQQVAAMVEQARDSVAALIGAEGREIVFTSGATEANNLAIKGAARFALHHAPSSPRRIITVATEHKCVLESVHDLAREGFEPVILPVGADGLLDPQALREALILPALLVSIMTVNNETGVIQDIPTLARLAHERGALFHTDAAQAAGKIPLSVGNGETRVDLMSLSAHKMYGPKGIGALYVRRRPRTRLEPLFSGGGQERGLRSGTLPAPLIVGFGAACAIARQEGEAEAVRIAGLRDRLLSLLREALPGVSVNGSLEQRVAGNLNVAFPADRPEERTAQQLMAALPWLAMSTGSACTSAEVEPSYVLRAMGVSGAQAARSLRLGIGRYTSAADVDRAVAALARVWRDAPSLPLCRDAT
ncbi:Selenocysteine lyase [Granulibacter bethesdensis]|nr:Selenocysteine lyase [Granulibacter bethesdensis]